MKKKINVVILINNLEKKNHITKTIGRTFAVPTHRTKRKTQRKLKGVAPT